MKLIKGPRGGTYWLDENGKKHYVKQVKPTQLVMQVPTSASMQDTFNYVHREIVAECEYCGRPLTRSDVNDYGSLCREHYLQEYYN